MQRTPAQGVTFINYIAPAKKLVLSTHCMHRLVPIWNSLPGQCFVPDNLNAFRAKIRIIDFNRFVNGRD